MPELQSSDPTDAIPLPILSPRSPPSLRLRSHLTILALLLLGILGAYILDLSLLRHLAPRDASWSASLAALLALVCAAAAALGWTGALGIDWWELVVRYWWFSMPVAAAAGLLFVRAQEGSSEIADVE